MSYTDPKISLVLGQTDRATEQQNITYNQAGLTYNQAGTYYGGLYGNADVKPISGVVSLIVPDAQIV